MPIVQSTSFILVAPEGAPTGLSAPNENNPLIGYDNLIDIVNLTSTTVQDGFPVANLVTPVTYQRWRGLAQIGEQYITMLFDTVEIVDYVAIAGHNFGSSANAIALEVAFDVDSNGDPDWEELITPRLLVDDSPLLFRFNAVSPLGIRIVLADGVEDPYAAVVYLGELLVLPRRFYVGHRPMNFNRQIDVLSGKSETGQFLGRVVRRQNTDGAIKLSKVPPDTYRESIEPWVVHAETKPFFFAWRPGSYPTEVAYCWATSDPNMQNELTNGMVQMSMSLQGIVK